MFDQLLLVLTVVYHFIIATVHSVSGSLMNCYCSSSWQLLFADMYYNLLMIPPTTVMLQLHVRSLKHQQEITPCLSASTFFLFALVIKSARNCLWHLLTWHTCWDINYQSNITSFIYPHLQSAPSWEWPHLDFKEIWGVKRITVPNRHSLPDW